MGRQRIGRQAMSAAERQRRYIERLKSAADNPAPGALHAKTVAAWWRDATKADRDEFLRELLRYRYFHPWLESKGIVTNEIPPRSAPAIRLDWEIDPDGVRYGWAGSHADSGAVLVSEKDRASTVVPVSADIRQIPWSLASSKCRRPEG
jgi:hypothetical protein